MKTILKFFLGMFFISTVTAQQQLWTRAIGGPEQDIPTIIKADNNGNVYSMGEFESTVDFNPGTDVFELTSNSFSDPYLLKLDANGNFLWAKSFPFIQDSSTSKRLDFAFDDSNNIYVVISYQNTINIDGNSMTHEALGSSDIVIIKIDPNGTILWSNSIGSVNTDTTSKIVYTSDNHFLIMGQFSGSLDFDPSLNSEVLNPIGIADTFILKINTEGAFTWVKQLGTQNGELYSMDMDTKDTSISLVGSFRGIVDFDPNTEIELLDAGNTSDGYVLKLDLDGNFQWVSTFESEEDSSHWIRTHTIDSEGNIIFGGGLAHTVDFDPGPDIFLVSPTDIDGFIVKLDSLGNLQWAISFGGIDAWYNEVRGVTTETTGNIIATGKFLATTDFDPDPTLEYNLTSFGKKDTFLLMLSADSDFIHASHIGGPEWDVGTNLYIDNDNHIYLCSTFRETADLEFGENELFVTSNGDADIFITKIASNSLEHNLEVLRDTKIGISPNPTSGNMQIIGLEENKSYTIYLYDSFGKLIKTWENVYKKNQLYLELPSGVYILKIKSDRQLFVEKLIKK